MSQLNLFESEQRCNCQRCGALCKVDPLAGSKARMLKRGKLPKGLCVNCAVHDFLRNTYPVNLLLAQGGARALALPHIQEQFAWIMKSNFSDAAADEIGWQAIIDNWDLPFPNKLKPSARNPVNQAELDRMAKEGVPAYRPDLFRSAEEQNRKTKEILKRVFGDVDFEIQ